MIMRSPYTYTLLRANTARCALRPGVCPNVAFPWVQCRFEEHPRLRAYFADIDKEESPEDYWSVVMAIAREEHVAPAVGVAFFLRGHGEPPEHFPYRCLRSRPETHETHEKDDPS